MVTRLENLDEELKPTKPSKNKTTNIAKVKIITVKPFGQNVENPSSALQQQNDNRIKKKPVVKQEGEKDLFAKVNKTVTGHEDTNEKKPTVQATTKNRKNQNHGPIDRSRSTSTKTAISSDENQSEKPREKVTTSIRLFCERVSIAGLDMAFKAKIKAEIVMWYSSYILACVLVVYMAYNVVEQYTNSRTVYDHYPLAGEQAPFPNVSVCLPIGAKKEKLRKMISVPDKVRAMAERKRVPLEKIIEFTLRFWSFDGSSDDFDNELFKYAAFRIMEATSKNYPRGFSDTLTEIYPTCDDVLSNCYFEGRPVDCCRNTRSVYLGDQRAICFHLSATLLQDENRLPTIIGGPTPDAVHLEKSGLEIRVELDWRITSFQDNAASDGFLLMIGSVATPFSEPIAIPSNADAFIVLAPPRKLIELTECRSSDDLPNLPLFDYYDPYGIHCVIDELMGTALEIFGCDLKLYDHEPKNGSLPCSGEMLLSYGIGGSKVEASNVDMTTLATNKQIARMVRYAQTIGHVQQIIKDKCPPFCSRWIYAITSASYNFISLNGRQQWDRDSKENQSWSRIRLFFPEASYHLHSEKPKAPQYAAFYEVGGLTGVFLGASVITIVHTIVYGVFVIYTLCGYYKRRVRIR